MITTLTLPALAFLMAITGIPGLNSLPWLKSLVRHKPHTAVADSLPPHWRPAPLIALEPSILQQGLPLFGRVPAGIQLGPSLDPRRLVTTVDPDSGTVRTSVVLGEVTLGDPFRRPIGDFGASTMRETFASKWRDMSRQKVNSGAGGIVSQHTGLSLPIPVQLPSVVSSILGPGGPALNVSGSESIRLSGTSDWSNQTVGLPLGARRSLFPSLDMQQDLNIQLEGQLSDRVKVNLLQNSANQVPLSNLIAINYKGEEDDLVQELALGNTSLSLPGTQYVSYSGRNEGLFGIKLATRLGPLDFTALASKQEGKSERASYTGGASFSQHPPILDVDYDKGRYFLLYDPQYALFKIDDASIQIYRDDGNYGNDFPPHRALAMVDPGHKTGVPMSAVTDTAAFRGSFDLLHAGDDYDILPDYYVLSSGVQIKIIRLKTPIQPNTNMCLAASFAGIPVDVNGNALGPAVTVGGDKVASGVEAGTDVYKLLYLPHSWYSSLQDPTNTFATFDTSETFDAVRELEMKNFYSLGGFGIDPSGFKLQIQHGTQEPPALYAHTPDGTPINFLEVLGLDNFDESQATRVKGHDEKVDGSAYTSGARLFIDFANGVLWFPDPRPFAPRVTGAKPRWFDQLIDANLNRRLRLVAPGDSLNSANNFYDLYNPISSQATRFNIVTTFAAQRGGGDITLGRGNILAGSDVVTVNGERWTRDRDYTIDYDLGHVTLKRNLGATDQLAIDYSYAPLFAQASKTLLGSAFRLEGRDRSFGGAFLYESQGAQDLRPRLGEEPSRTLITDLNTEWRFKPDFVTRAIDHLPGVRTTTPSDLTVQAEMGASFPNPNTKNEVYIDDMEGVRDAVSLSLAPERWLPMSVPSRRYDAAGNPLPQPIKLTDMSDALGSNTHQWNAELHWYYPYNTVKEHDLKPTLTQAQGGENVHQVLALSVPRFPTPSNGPGTADTAITNPTVKGPSEVDSVWAGLTYQIDDRGIDLSRSQFIELWVNDFNDRHDPRSVDGLVRRNHMRLHIDLGVVSEAQMRAPNRPPDGILHSEDLPPRDHQLTLKEDVGYDAIDDNIEQQRIREGSLAPADVTTSSAEDPEGDDWFNVTDGRQAGYKDIDPRHWRWTNGTEGNKSQFPYPNTEDMNLNDNLDTDERYYEYTVDLGQTMESGPYLENDVSLANPGGENGWRRYRIPIGDDLRDVYGSPDLTIARHVRLWFSGLRGPDPNTGAEIHPILEIGGLDIVGSRWLSTDLTPSQKLLRLTTQTLNSVNSVDNADIYVSPFDPGTTLNGSQSLPRREQSISMEFQNLAGTDTLEAYRTFSIDEDYSRYGKLHWWVTSFGVNREVAGVSSPLDVARDSSFFYFVRFASDERGTIYYEIKRRLPPNMINRDKGAWREIVVDMHEMANFKIDTSYTRTNQFRGVLGSSGDSVIIVGRPSFTRLRRISFGLSNEFQDSTVTYTGQLWMDEMRAVDVQKDVGLADRLLVTGHLANLASYNVSWNSRDADFLSVGDTRGTGSRQTNLSVTSSVNPERFFEGTGIQVPVTMVYNESSVKPRFTVGDDIVRTGVQQEASQTRSISRSLNTSYSRTWSDRSNPLLRYTVGGLTGSASRTQSENVSPTGKSSTVGTAATVQWGVALRKLAVLNVPGTKAKLYLLPDRVYSTYNWSRNSALSYVRNAGGVLDSMPSVNNVGTNAGLSMGVDSHPFEMIQHHIEAQRSLSLTGLSHSDRLAGVDLGRTTAWRQNFSAHWTAVGNRWVQPTVSWTSNFSTAADLQSQDLSAHNAMNGQSWQMNWTLPFDQINSRSMQPAPLMAQTPPPGDSSAVKRPAPRTHVRLSWKDLLMHLGNLQTDATLNRSSAYSRLTGMPSFLYSLGVVDDPGLTPGHQRVSLDPINQTNTGIDWRANARTRVPLVFGSAISTRFSLGDRSSSANGVTTRTSDARFPDLDFEYGRLAEVIHLTRFLQQPQLRTSWVHSTSADYRGTGTTQIGRTSTNDFHPLLSMRGNMHNGTTADLGVNMRNTLRETNQFGTSTTTDDNLDVNLTVSRNYTAGQKISFLGKTKTVRSSGSLQLATVYSRHTGGTQVSNSNVSNRPVNDTRLSVTGTGNYGFSSNVNGSAVLGFTQTHDIVLDNLRRSVRVELRAQFTF